MNWENSNAATDLKRDFLKAWFSEDQRFFLTGGSALGMVYFLEKSGHDILAHLSDAGEKDAGLEPGILSHLLASFRIESEPDFMIKALDLEMFRSFVDRIRLELAKRALPPES